MSPVIYSKNSFFKTQFFFALPLFAQYNYYDDELISSYFSHWSLTELETPLKAVHDMNITTYKISSKFASTSILEILLFNSGYTIDAESYEYDDIDYSDYSFKNLVRKRRGYIEAENNDWQIAYDYDREVMEGFGDSFKGWQDNWETLDYSDEYSEAFVGQADLGQPLEEADDIKSIIADIKNHGCWGSVHDADTNFKGKRGHPVSSLDFQSRQFSRCRHCNKIHGPCAEQDLNKEIFLKWNGQEYICPVAMNSCDYEICNCALDWAINSKALIDEIGAVYDKNGVEKTCPVKSSAVSSSVVSDSLSSARRKKTENIVGSLRSMQTCLGNV